MTMEAKKAIEKLFYKKHFDQKILNGFQCFIAVFDVFNRLSVFALFHRICRFHANNSSN